jgi:hypothetical protein
MDFESNKFYQIKNCSGAKLIKTTLSRALADSDAAVRRFATLKLEELSNSKRMDYNN